MKQPYRVVRPSASSRDPSDDFWYGRVSRPVAAGVSVSVETALTVPVVFDCLQALSQSIGPLPFGIFERAADGSKQRRDQHPLMRCLMDPNPETTSTEFFGQMVFDLASEGNFYAEIRGGVLGPVSEMWRLEPACVTVQRLPDGSKRFEVREGATTRRLVDDEVWHIKAFPHVDGGLKGMSPIHAGREAIGAAIALQDYAARFFANDATPPFVIEHPTNFKDDDSKTNFLTALKRWWGGARRHSPGVLEYGMKLNRVGVNNEEAQFLETRKELAYEIARLWRMPPHKVGMLERATNNNIEHQSLEFVTDTLLPWIGLIEKSVRKYLIINSERFFFEFNVAGLLRGDMKARYEAYAQGRQWGWLSVNDIRKLENMNPIRNGDAYLQPLNMVPAGSAPPPEAARPDAEILGPHGRPVSRIFGGNVVRLKDYADVA
jgi:HK97 family phage portal protein